MAHSPGSPRFGDNASTVLAGGDTSLLRPPVPSNDSIPTSSTSPIQPVEVGLFQTGQQVTAAINETSTPVIEDSDHQKKLLNAEQTAKLLAILCLRFHNNLDRHLLIDWQQVQTRLENHPEKLWSIQQMEETGGEPDIVGIRNGKLIIIDCSIESPPGRSNIVYDREAEAELKRLHPNEHCNGNAVDKAAAMRVKILGEKDNEQYLQKKGQFDRNSMSWIFTPPEKRAQGVALYAYRDEEGYFIGEIRAHSLYADRSFRAIIEV